MAAPAEMKPLYLFSGNDVARIDQARQRLRARAESEGGSGALEAHDPPDERRGPDAEALAAALPAASLAVTRRYLLADGVERWKQADLDAFLPALPLLAPETTLVLIARGDPPEKLAAAVKAAGGEVRAFQAPRARDLPGWAVQQAKARDFKLEPGAARLLVERMGTGQLRLANELDRLALWAGTGGSVTEADLESMVADTSETMVWALSDAVIDRSPERALAVAERLSAGEERGGSIVYAVARRLRQAVEARSGLDAGRSAGELRGKLGMPPYAAKKLLEQVDRADLAQLRAALCALADLESWTRGGSDYPEDVAVTMAISRAVEAA